MSKKFPKKQGVVLKKKYGQHFLQDPAYIQRMLSKVTLDQTSCVLEIGCGEGALTKEILKLPIKKVWVFEIDEQWIDVTNKTCNYDERLTIFHEDILQANLSKLQEEKTWILIANLPYNITFPILHVLHQYKNVISNGVIMIQEEVAQKIVKTSGRGYGYPSLFFQHYFHWKLMEKVPPTVFYPPPKVHSRFLSFQTRVDHPVIEQEDEFWKFIKMCFHQPRRTLRNNLMQSHYDLSKFSDELLQKRAQQLAMQDFLSMWKLLIS
jgi:16S rRNA (adenine1518-N6/adenine1519-N6)-dimethyltransferase